MTKVQSLSSTRRRLHSREVSLEPNFVPRWEAIFNSLVLVEIHLQLRELRGQVPLLLSQPVELRDDLLL